jgi:hypothetical protein
MLRAKITAKPKRGFVHVTVDWVDVVENVVGATQFTEEFRVSKEIPVCGYVSRVAFTEAVVSPGTFWLDEKGLRHFLLQADPGHIDHIGMDAAIEV